jgi:type I restriction enzyme S subunit
MTDLLPEMPRYEAYKDSGVAWIGEIPEHWHIKRIKFLFKEINIRSTSGLEDLLSVSQYTGVTKRKHKFNNDEDIITTASSLEGYKKVFKGDLVSNIMLAWNGCIGFSKYNGITSPAYSIYRLKVHAVEKYFHYLFPTEIYKAEFKRKSSGVIESRLRLYTEDFFSIWSLLPPLHEQTTIANFLDCKTAKIDQAVSVKEKQIRLLKERKQILIQTAVTKGIDPNVPVADSGVEWIGQVPAHWNIVANRTLFKERVEPGQDDLPLLSVSIHSGISDDEVSEEENIRGRVKIEDKTKYNLVKPNVIVFNMMRAWQGAIGAAKVTGMVSPAYIIATPKETLHASYFEYQYRCPIFIQQMDRFSKGITDFRKRLYWHEFKQLLTILPPVGEQKVIVNHIQTQSAKIDQAIAIQEQMIEKLKEYKATLINAAVIGKIKVPDGRE